MKLKGAGSYTAATTDNPAHDLALEVVHAPDLEEPLLSASQTADLPNVKRIVLESEKKSKTEIVDHSHVLFMDNSRVKLVRKEGLYYLPVSRIIGGQRRPQARAKQQKHAGGFTNLVKDKAKLAVSRLPTRDQTQLAHRRLCHPTGLVLACAPNLGLTIDNTYAQTLECLECGTGKSKRRSHKYRPSRRRTRPCAWSCNGSRPPPAVLHKRLCTLLRFAGTKRRSTPTCLLCSGFPRSRRNGHKKH